jgi:hypothetical protein
MKYIAIVASLLFLVLLADALTFQANSQTDMYKRKFTVVAGFHFFQLTGIKVDDGTGHAPKIVDAVRFTFATDWLPRHVLQFFHRSTDSIDAVAVRHHLWKVIEYEEKGTAGSGYSPDQDTRVSQFKFWNTSWSDMQYTKDIADDGTTVVHQICTGVNGPQPRPDVTICLYLAEGAVTFRGIHHDPNAVKWSLNIANYPYQKNDSLLALKFHYASRMAIVDFGASDNKTWGAGNNEAAVTAGDDGAGNKGLSSHVVTVNVTGTGCSPTGTVVRTVIREGEWTTDIDADLPQQNSTDPDFTIQFDGVKRVGYYSFITDCQPASVFWDPQLGVGQSGTSSAGSAVLPSLLFALFALVALFL